MPVARLAAVKKRRLTGTASRSAGREGKILIKISQEIRPEIMAETAPVRFAFGHQMPAVSGTKRVARSIDQESTIRA